MGIMSYRIGADGSADRIPESALGAFRDPALLPIVFPGLVDKVESQLAPASEDKRIVEIDYCSDAFAIYHLEPIDDIVIRHWGEDGKLERATFLLGRFSQGAFAQRAADVPLLREKRQWLIDRSGAASMSHAFRQVRALFNRFPRRELFYAPVEELRPFFDRIVHITGDNEIAVHHRIGPGYAALYRAFLKLRYSYEAETALRRAFSERFGPIGFTASEDAGPAQVLIFYFDLDRLEHPIDEDQTLRITEDTITTWKDAVSRALTEAFGEREGRRLFARWITYDTRSGIYREATPPEEVPFDVERLELLDARLQVAVVPRSPEHVTLKIYATRPLSFIETLTTLSNLGLGVTGELHIEIRLPSRRTAHMHRYEIEDTAERIAAVVDGADRLTEALRALDEERATDGSLNALILTAGLDWRHVEVLRTFRAHLQQIRPHYNLETVNGVLLSNSNAARALYRAFEARFDPTLGKERPDLEREVEADLQRALDDVGNLVDDEVLRAFSNLIASTVRTNFYQRPERPVFSMKVESHQVEGMPSPKPMFEVYLHSRRLEGIHLRGGRVARGGIRWSDRHDDFRTEILDLQKTQTVKNSIIVPVGSKGGFVLKWRASHRDRRSMDTSSIATASSSQAFSMSPTTWSTETLSIRPRSFAMTTTIRTSSWLLTRGRHICPIPPTWWLGTTAFGSVTRSLPEAVSATTTRKSGSPPGGRGSASNTTFTTLASTSTRTTSPLLVSVTWAATFSATGCCDRAPSSWWGHSTTCTSSSIRIPTRRRASKNGSDCSGCHERAGATTTRRSSATAVGSSTGLQKKISLTPEMRESLAN